MARSRRHSGASGRRRYGRVTGLVVAPGRRVVGPKGEYPFEALIRLAADRGQERGFANVDRIPLALYLFVTATVDATYVGAAWVVGIFRVRHSAGHCTFNLVMLRFYLYLVSMLAVWFMLARAALAHFGG
jgi:hypothetical protein